MMDHWAVTVSRSGEEIVTIESNCLSGREISQEDENAIRTAALHLLAFIGESGAPCDDCPPVGYPTDKTRCLPCPRR